MPAIFDKIDWGKNSKGSLSRQAIANLSDSNPSAPAISSIAHPDTSKVSAQIEPERNRQDKKENLMVTSTIVETNSSVESEQAKNHANKFSAIKDASVKQDNSSSHGKKRGRDYSSGMDLLEMDFILGVVEDTTGENKYDIQMRQMCFKELLRRESRHEIASAALKVYATNGKTYGKDLQCQAMEELSFRTAQNS